MDQAVCEVEDEEDKEDANHNRRECEDNFIECSEPVVYILHGKVQLKNQPSQDRNEDDTYHFSEEEGIRAARVI